MASGVPKLQILSLYKALLRESSKFSSYNIRSYALRRVRDAYKENKNINDPSKIKELQNFANEQFDIVKRQVNISKMYTTDKLVIENKLN